MHTLILVIPMHMLAHTLTPSLASIYVTHIQQEAPLRKPLCALMDPESTVKTRPIFLFVCFIA